MREDNDVTEEELRAVLAEFGPCNHAVACAVVRLRRQVAAMQRAIAKAREVMDEHVMRGEEYSWKRESFFGPTVQCTVTSRRGDLCDMRQAPRTEATP